MMMNRSVKTSIAVAGCGPAGLAFALAALRAGLDVTAFGPRPKPETDARTAALIGPSVDFLRGLGVWEVCEPHAAPLKSLAIIDQTGRLLRAPDITFHAAEIGAEAFGYNVPNAILVRVMMAALEAHGEAFHETAGIAAIEPRGATVSFRLAEGEWREAALLAGADGRNSLSREAAGLKARVWDYGHTAIACSLAHERPHEGACVELHRASGPFTLVPLPGARSSLVWVERPERAAALMALSPSGFAAAIGAEAGALLGRVSDAGPRSAFPLSGLAVARYAQNRIALIGEAAHVVPPIGAQGLNLGFRDGADLTAILRKARDEGRDIGGDAVLAAYNAKRRADVLTRTLAADVLNRTLISGFSPFDAARSLGLAALSASGPLRRLMMRRGAGAS